MRLNAAHVIGIRPKVVTSTSVLRSIKGGGPSYNLAQLSF